MLYCVLFKGCIMCVNKENEVVLGHITVLGVDNIIHCSNHSDTTKSACNAKVPVKRVDPDFEKLSDIIWCYECSDILED